MSDGSPTVAVLGAGGAMGFAIARNCARAGLRVRAWNRSREKAAPLERDGAQVLDSPVEAVRGADLLVTMLADADAVLETLGDGADSLLASVRDGLAWVQMSTIGVAGTERCAAQAAEHGVTFLDCPVLGSRQPAEERKLVLLASGPEEARSAAEPLFSAIGSRTMWLGPAGAGSRLKVVVNVWIVGIVETLAEAIALAEGSDVDPRWFLEAVSGGVLDLPYLQMKGSAIIERDFEPAFKLALAAKDARLAAELAARHGLELPLIETVAARLT
ncbi:MAG: NAD(P)-dependent oxidoreductase [Solirubrobacteraceae bacterium]